VTKLTINALKRLKPRRNISKNNNDCKERGKSGSVKFYYKSKESKKNSREKKGREKLCLRSKGINKRQQKRSLNKSRPR